MPNIWENVRVRWAASAKSAACAAAVAVRWKRRRNNRPPTAGLGWLTRSDHFSQQDAGQRLYTRRNRRTRSLPDRSARGCAARGFAGLRFRADRAVGLHVVRGLAADRRDRATARRALVFRSDRHRAVRDFTRQCARPKFADHLRLTANADGPRGRSRNRSCGLSLRFVFGANLFHLLPILRSRTGDCGGRESSDEGENRTPPESIL